MPVQLPPLDRRYEARRETAARIQAKGPQVRIDPWTGPRHRRWTAADVVTYTDAFPITFALFIAYLMIGR